MLTAPDAPARYGTLAEQVEELRASWDGPRCPHGTPLNAPGPDLICGRCEAEMAEEIAAEEFLKGLDARFAAGDGYPFPIGPCRDGNPDDRRVLWGADRPTYDETLPF